MVESLRNSDRIHAISFGEFYLKAYQEKADWKEIKEAFQHWNIDGGSSFNSQNANDFDPKIFKNIILFYQIRILQTLIIFFYSDCCSYQFFYFFELLWRKNIITGFFLNDFRFTN